MIVIFVIMLLFGSVEPAGSKLTLTSREVLVINEDFLEMKHLTFVDEPHEVQCLMFCDKLPIISLTYSNGRCECWKSSIPKLFNVTKRSGGTKSSVVFISMSDIL